MSPALRAPVPAPEVLEVGATSRRPAIPVGGVRTDPPRRRAGAVGYLLKDVSSERLAKLGVRDRTQAALRAQALDLL
jgi:hypothetical protein